MGDKLELVRVARLLQCVSNDPELPTLVQDLIGPNTEAHNSALAVLELLAALRGHGHEAHLLARSMDRTPDFVARLVARDVLVESTGLHESRSSCESMQVVDDLMQWGEANRNTLHGAAQVNFCGSPEQSKKVLQEIKTWLIDCAAEGVDATTRLDDYTEICYFAGRDTWPTIRTSGPVIDQWFRPSANHDIVRIQRRLREKHDQMPADRPNIIVVAMDLVYAASAHCKTALLAALSDVAVSMAACLSGHPRIGGVILNEHWIGEEEPRIDLSGPLHSAVLGTVGSYSRLVQYIPNPSSLTPVVAEEADIVVRALMNPPAI